MTRTGVEQYSMCAWLNPEPAELRRCAGRSVPFVPSGMVYVIGNDPYGLAIVESDDD